MSGHSKWHSIRQKKGAIDAKRGKVFSKLSKAISMSAREGGPDPSINFSLRLAIEKAKQANMPKENIERAIEKATGAGASDNFETVLYEGMGPGGSALLVEVVTDNKNRSHANVKIVFNKFGGNMDAKVLWMFDRKGVIRVEDASSVEDRDSFELELIDRGAEAISWDDGLEIVCDLSVLQDVEAMVTSEKLIVAGADPEYIAKDVLNLNSEDEGKLERLIEALDDDDDVTNIFTNAG
ncbi:YebC/PmpR family DNA-binding transcriptional regulator [Patescibacteria group bacterium]|nr:YebC/PmpR family DNA-binding transcriptional regulator [Patescibacteria group bacterium]